MIINNKIRGIVIAKNIGTLKIKNIFLEEHEQFQGYKFISRDLNDLVSTVHKIAKKFTVANLPGPGQKMKN